MSPRYLPCLAFLLAASACGTPPRVFTVAFINVPPAGAKAYISETRAGFLQPALYYTYALDLIEGENQFVFPACMPVQVWVVGFHSWSAFDPETRIDLSELLPAKSSRPEEQARAKRETDTFIASHQARSCLPP